MAATRTNLSFRPSPGEIAASILLITASLFFGVMTVVFWGGLILNVVQIYVCAASLVLSVATGSVGWALLNGRPWARCGAAILALFFIGGLLFLVVTV